MLEQVREMLVGYRAGKAVYGIIIALAIVITLEVHPPGALEAELTLVFGALAVAIAEFYSDYLQRRIDQKEGVSIAQMRQIGRHIGTVMVGALLPIPVFILVTLGLLSIETAFIIVKWMLVCVLFLYGYVAAMVSGAGFTWSIILGSMVGMIGLFVVLAKATLSH